jgi:response regulator RpfG family c-di-GMP phosphodiesterase
MAIGSEKDKIPRCIVVDDNFEILEIVEAYLKKLGSIESESFKTPTGVIDALVDAQASGNPFDIIILDCNMPEMEGPELLKQIRNNEHIGKITALMMTGEPEKYNIQSCFEVGANDFLLKPFDFKIFSRRVESLFKIFATDDVDFCPIRSSTLQINKPLNFDVFLAQFGQFRILLKANELVPQEFKNLLKEKGLKKLYIISSDEANYQSYLSEKISGDLKSKDNTIEDKADVISDYNSLVLKNVYKNLDDVNVAELQKLTSAVQEFVRPLEKKAVGALLKQNDQSGVYGHSLRVATICVLILNKIASLKREDSSKHENLLRPFNSTFNANTKTISYVTEAALLHDIGKVMAPEGHELTEDINGLHAHWGRELLAGCEHLKKDTAETVGDHEELCDGSGGPLGIAKNKTSLFSQLVSMASKADHLLTEENLTAKEVIKYFEKNDKAYFAHYVKVLKLAL